MYLKLDIKLHSKNNCYKKGAGIRMGCIEGISRILKICLVLCMLVLAFVSPPDIMKVSAGNTVTVTFNPDGNVSLNVWPATYDFATIYANSSKATTATYFTIQNNGTVNGMYTDAQITSGAAAMSLYDGVCIDAGDNYYSINASGAISNNTFLHTSEARNFDDNLAKGSTKTFGLTLYISNLTTNLTARTVVITLTAGYS